METYILPARELNLNPPTETTVKYLGANTPNFIIAIDEIGKEYLVMNDTSSFKSNIDQYLNDNGDLSRVVTTHINNMSSLFLNATSFNQDIGKWDVSNVTTIAAMFLNAHLFDQYIGDWDVSNVQNMGGTFECASSFNQDIGNWNISNVNNMAIMFLMQLHLIRILVIGMYLM